MKGAKRCSPKHPSLRRGRGEARGPIVAIRDRARWLLEDKDLLRKAQEKIAASIRTSVANHFLHGPPPLTLEELLREATRTQQVLLERGSRLEIFLTVGPVEPLKPRKPVGLLKVRRRP